MTTEHEIDRLARQYADGFSHRLAHERERVAAYKAGYRAATEARRKWTSEAPTLAGWYWARVPSSGYLDTVEVRDMYGQMSFFDAVDRLWRPLRHAAHFQWSGPIPQPESGDIK